MLAQEVQEEIERSGGLGSAHQDSEVLRIVAELSEVAEHPSDDDIARATALTCLHRLGACLDPAIANMASGKGVTAYELEVGGVPQTLLALLEGGHVSGSALVDQLGDASAASLAAALLRLVETTEALPVGPLPPYLSQAPGLRMLCEPLVVVLRHSPGIERPSESSPFLPPEMEQRWLQLEPLLRVEELERLVLMTMPILDEGFLTWCLSLIDRDVAKFDKDTGSSSTIFGHVIDFHLATPLRIPVHTVRRSDGREVDLVSSIHGLAAVKTSDVACLHGVALRVALLLMQAALQPTDFSAAVAAVRTAVQGREAIFMGEEQDFSTASVVPPEAKQVLRVLGFSEPGELQGTAWKLGDGDPTILALLEELTAQQDGPAFRQRAASSFTFVEPDADLVSQLSAIFPEHGAKRACAAVKNASVEAAMEWACQHQGDPDFNDPLPDPSARGCSADAKALVWSVFIMLPQGVPFDLVWPMIEDPVKGALTSVANAWTAMGWAGGEAEMRSTLRTVVEKTGEGPIARGLPRAKAERVASRLRAACECRVEADPEGASNAPRGRGQGGGNGLALGARVQLVLEAEQLGIVVSVGEDENGVDVVTDDGRLLSLPNDQVRVASRTPSSPAAGSPGPRAPSGSSLQLMMQGGTAPDTSTALTSVAELITSPPLAPFRCSVGALDRGAQESDVLRRWMPQDLLAPQDASAAEGADATGPAATSHQLVSPPTCRVAFSVGTSQEAGLDDACLCLLRGERSWLKPGEGDGRSFASTSWLTVGIPGAAIVAGSWFYEVELTKFKNPQIGWADASFRFLVGAYSDDGIGDDGASWAADGERSCLWHRGRYGDWRTATTTQTICCAIAIDASAKANMWFAVDGAWETEPAFQKQLFDTYIYPAVSGELDVRIRIEPSEMNYGPPDPSFRPIAEALASSSSSILSRRRHRLDSTLEVPRHVVLPPHWTVLQGLYHLTEHGLPDAPVPLVLRSKVHVDAGIDDSSTTTDQCAIESCPHALIKQVSGISEDLREAEISGNPLALRRAAIEEGLPLELSSLESDRALEVCGIHSASARAALRLLRKLQADPTVASAIARHVSCWEAASSVGTSAVGAEAEETSESQSSSSAPAKRGGSQRLGTKLQRHLGHPLACCSGAFPRWCRELPILVPWLFPLEAREVLLRCYAFGVTFAVWWLQERAVDERFAERRRNMEERLAQAKHIGDAALLNSAYEALFELQSVITRDSEAWVGALKSELAKVERERILQQAERAMELTKASPCALEVQFDGESGFGKGVTQGFYTLVAHELQRRTGNREAPMWVEDVGFLNEVSDDFLCPRRGLFMKPLPQDDPRLPEVERRFCMLGRLMAKALREGFVVPLPLTAAFFQLVLGGCTDPLMALPRPGDGVVGEFLGACAALVADASDSSNLAELARDPEWSRKYMQPPGEEAIPAVSFDTYASAAFFVETGLSGAPLCSGGEDSVVTAENVREFVRLASDFWLDIGVQRQLVAFRRGLYDVLGGGAVALWAFGAAELRRLFCGENEVVWTDKELAEHLHCGGGFSQNSTQLRWLREELVSMQQPLRAKFLEFVTSCPRLPPGGLKELQISIHPDPNGAIPGMPRSRACAHRLFLPRYGSREELARQLNEAILSSGGHHELELPP
jgi:hypothetical protein